MSPRLRAALAACGAALLCPPSAAAPSASERRDLERLGREARGFVVWESNRTGQAIKLL